MSERERELPKLRGELFRDSATLLMTHPLSRNKLTKTAQLAELNPEILLSIITHVMPYIYLHVPEPWVQLIHSSYSVRESEQGQIEGAPRVETLMSRIVHILWGVA